MNLTEMTNPSKVFGFGGIAKAILSIFFNHRRDTLGRVLCVFKTTGGLISMKTYKNIKTAINTFKALGFELEGLDKKKLREIEFCQRHSVSIAKTGLKASATNKKGETKLYNAVQLSDGSVGVYIYGDTYLTSAWDGVELIE